MKGDRDKSFVKEDRVLNFFTFVDNIYLKQSILETYLTNFSDSTLFFRFREILSGNTKHVKLKISSMKIV